MRKFIAIILAVAVLFILIDLVEPSGFGFFSRVNHGNVAVVTQFGKIQEEVLEAGFHVKPFFNVLHPMSIQTQTIKTTLSAFSSDVQHVDTVVTINYNLEKEKITSLFKNVGRNHELLMTPRIQENVKIVFARYTAEDLVQCRDLLSIEISDLLQDYLATFGINVTAIAVEDIDFTDAFTNAVEAKQVATQERLTAQTQQERLTMEARAQAQRATILAEAEAEKARIAAEAEAYTLEIMAEAEAKANEKIASSLSEELIDYTRAQSWNGQLPNVIGDNSTIMDVTGFVD